MSKILIEGKEKTFVLAWIPPRSRAWDKGFHAGSYLRKRSGRGKANPKVYYWAWSSVPLQTTEERYRRHLHPKTIRQQAPYLHPSKAVPGLFMNSLAFPGLHMPRKSWAGFPSYATLQWKRSPEAEKVSAVQLKWGVVRLHLGTASCHSNMRNKKVWCESSSRDVLYNILPRASQSWACVRVPGGLVNTDPWAPPQRFWFSRLSRRRAGTEN